VKGIIVSKEHVEEIIFNSRYPIDEKKEKMSLDVVGAVSKAGEDFGFEVYKNKVESLIKALKLLQDEEEEKILNFDVILQVKGNYNIRSAFTIETGQGAIAGKFYIFHQTLMSKLLYKIAQELVEEKAVKLFPGCDQEYLYEVLFSSIEDNLYESIKKTGKDIPFYLVKFKDDGNFKVVEMGSV